jgi:hypothetical protein
MSHPAYLRAKARELRTERRLTIDEIAERLALPRTTIFHWVRDLPIAFKRVPGPPSDGSGTRAMQAKYRLAREHAYAEGRRTFAVLAADPWFRDFLCLYLAEGSKRDRNRVGVCNSDPAVVKLCDASLRRITSRALHYSVQYRADQDVDELRRFWAAEVGVEPESIRLQRKSNSNQLAGRTWRSPHGVLTVSVNDTLLRARLQGWLDCLRESWL